MQKLVILDLNESRHLFMYHTEVMLHFCESYIGAES